jgi:plasmid stabilization system protein ParE
VDYRILYTQRALNDLAEIIGHIAEDDADASSRFGNSLLDHIDLLAGFPRLGGAIQRRRHIRKLIHSPFLVYYKLDDERNEIEILHIRHGARQPPKAGLLS